VGVKRYRDVQVSDMATNGFIRYTEDFHNLRFGREWWQG